MKALLLIAAMVTCTMVYSQNDVDTIYAVVNGNQVTIHQDDARYNCAFTPIPNNVVLNDHVIDWYKIDTTGQIALCLCYFNYSVNIDSLQPGDYTVNVYSAIISPYTSPDSVYEGSTHFTISGPYQCDNLLELSSYIGPCHQYDGIRNQNKTDDNYTISQNAEGLSISGRGTDRIGIVKLSNLSGQEVLKNYYDAASSVYISTNSLSKGFYIVTISDGQKIATNRKVAIR
jgi:hypothetical protein